MDPEEQLQVSSRVTERTWPRTDLDSTIALSANGTLRYSLGATFPLFTIQMYQKLGVHWAGSLFAFLSLALLPIPWLLFKWGPTLRSKSHFDASPVGIKATKRETV